MKIVKIFVTSNRSCHPQESNEVLLIHIYDIKNYIPLLPHNFSGYDNHLILPKLPKNMKRVTFYPLVKTLKGIYFSIRKYLKSKIGKIFSKSCSLTFNDGVRLMNDSLNSLVKNLRCSIYNTTCKHCMKWKDCN